jgi:Zn-dependent protease with chaperone function
MGIEGRAVYRQNPGAGVRPVTVVLDMRGLAIRGLDGEPVTAWPFAQLLRLKPRGRAALVLGAGGETGRVEFTDAATAAAFDAALRTIPEAGSIVIRRAYGGLAIVAGVVAAALLTGGWWLLGAAGDLLAPAVDDRTLRALDTAGLPAVLERLDVDASARCGQAEGVAALDRMVDRIVDAGGAREMTLDVAVYRSPAIGSASLPGGTVILTSALVAEAEDGDALAGAVAHEIGHLHDRHGIAALMRRGGVRTTLSLLAGGGGGVGADLVADVVAGGWPDSDEIEADAFAIDAVAAGGGRPQAYTDFLEALAVDGAANATQAAIHPSSPDRIETAVARAQNRSPRPGPLVPPADVAAIRAICGAPMP